MQWHLEVWLQIETNQMPSLEPVFALSVLGEQVQSKGGKHSLKSIDLGDNTTMTP